MRGRVLQIFNRYLKLGGEELSVDRIAGHLSAEWEVESCLFHSREWVGEGAPPVWKQAAWVFRNPQACARIVEAHQRFQPDVWLIHNVHPVISAAVFAEAKKLGVPVIFILHNYKPFALVDGGLRGGEGEINLAHRWRNFFREIRTAAWQDSRLKTAWHCLAVEMAHLLGWYRSIAAWVAISPAQLEAFRKTTIPDERLHLLPHAWELSEPAPVDETNSMDYYLFLGRLIEAKGVRTLLDAWRQLGVGAPKLVIAGEGELEDEVRVAAERDRQISFAGLVKGEKKRELLRNCRALIAPSIWKEPLGLVAYEAYEFGKPVIATLGGGFEATVKDRVTGRLFPPGDASGLAAAVRAFEHAGVEDRQSMGRAGREWVEERASKEKWLAEFANIAEPIIARYAARRERQRQNQLRSDG
jgi:glycosyltransferase involved in cell wall biosynthesis